ncbi:hypothetical protein OB988_21750 [Bacillus cereus]|nr:hypothetical protein [Bacillus cereus]
MTETNCDKTENPEYYDDFVNKWWKKIPYIFTFQNFFHPYVEELAGKLNKESLSGLFDPNYHKCLEKEFFETFYTKGEFQIEFFPKKIDVQLGEPYANYNWELLFHIPLAIAVHLSKNQRFAEAQRWFHFIFDPLSQDRSIKGAKRYWKFLAFREGDDITQIDKLLNILCKHNPSPDETKMREGILREYDAIKNKPFQPHAVARTRPIAYQYYVVMKYLDNLIAWGDSLFRQDTVESVNEATQRYVLAANLLGVRPQRIPPKGASRPKTFAELKDMKSNALVDLEEKFPFNVYLTRVSDKDTKTERPLFGIGRKLYFCVPPNEKLLSYWDTVADRLFKIRNCMNIEGLNRQLALFDPPLDPGLLVKAEAVGINIGSIVSGMNQPISPVRATFLIQKALEICSEVRSLGSSLLVAIEKGDGEHLALLHQNHETKIHQIQQDVRFLQWKQTKESTESLIRSRALGLERYRYYERLLGLAPDSNTFPLSYPDQSADNRELTEQNFEEVYTELVEKYEKQHPLLQEYPPLRLEGDTDPTLQSGVSEQGKLYLNRNENAELNKHAPISRDLKSKAITNDNKTQSLALIPDLGINMHFWGLGINSTVFGGSILASFGRLVSSGLNFSASEQESMGVSAAKTASYERRADDWRLQYNLAARELWQTGRQIISSLIAEKVNFREYENTKKQIEYSQEIDQYLRGKFTKEEFYNWMQGEVSRLYYEYYRFAYDIARKAEQTMKHELMRTEMDATEYIKYNYWDGGRKGLVSGEALYLDVKRMEMAYHEHNKREYELIKHVSLRQLDPFALLTLKATGSCEVTIPEWLFDLDCPGHYMRRIKSVSLTFPSITGPYTSVNCTLTLLKSAVRKNSQLLNGDQYARAGSEDTRFKDYVGAIQSIVTSSGNNDSGLFETNLRDERFLPFEGSGTESTWRLELPEKFRQFDYNTITNVVFTIRYSSRTGGDQFQQRATANLESLVQNASTSGLSLLFNLAQDFSNEWQLFVNNKNKSFKATIKKDHFPYFTQEKNIVINKVELYEIVKDKVEHIPLKLNDQQLKEFSCLLKAKDQFDISIDSKILNNNKKVFLLFKYSLVESLNC